ncbi:hypothetical protein BJ138DRAFT_1165788 [Hygrophoropsis aurantiaca]|uniref:Uncharacterized protein n=1 Tax=Hygrophoropsis aurantiaca TaxID=72124 RepID=A0ACB7ZV07_9AGAM|nr:hypothetical protein BJ138DRAFT_1165788 [Hygrophoropsis aurantiaca]
MRYKFTSHSNSIGLLLFKHTVDRMSDTISLASHFQLNVYFLFSGLAIVAFDYCVTLNMEISWTWDRPWNYVRALFILARYTPFPFVSMYIYDTLGPITECSLKTEIKLWILCAVTVMGAEGLLLVRTWVFWGRNRAVLVGLIALGLGCIISGVTVDIIHFRSVTYTPIPLPGSRYFQPCSSAPYDISSYCGLAVFELAILFLSIFQIFQYKHHRRIFLIMRNDIVYISCILGLSVFSEEGYTDPAIIWQTVLHSVLASRLLFSMRQIMEQQPSIAFGSSAQPVPSRTVEMLPMVFEARTETVSGGASVEC